MTNNCSSFMELFGKGMNEVITVSPSKMNLWMDCRQLYKYVYLDSLKRSSSGTFKMNRGTFFHRYCHFFYNLKQQNLRSDTIELAMQSKFRDDLKLISKDNLPIYHSVLPLIERYILEQSPKIDAGIKVLGVEYEFWVPIITPLNRIVALHGIIDLVYLDRWGRIKIRDHKTSERLGSWSADKLMFSPQLRDYDLALNLNNSWNKTVGGVEVNWINTTQYAENSKAKGKDMIFELYQNEYSDQQREEYLQDKLHKIDLMLDGDIYRNYNKDCDKCSHFPICYREEKGLPTAATIATQFERIHRKTNQIEHRLLDDESSSEEGTTNRLPGSDEANFSLSLNL